MTLEKYLNNRQIQAEKKDEFIFDLVNKYSKLFDSHSDLLDILERLTSFDNQDTPDTIWEDARVAIHNAKQFVTLKEF